MEIKYTIEILTKDIQDIEKLVGNLGNSEEASAIELDLALSKLRNVYEILTMIKADRLHEFVREQLEEDVSASTPRAEAEPEPEPQRTPEPEPESTPEPEPAPDAKPRVDSGTEKSDQTILAEKFSAESSINENLAGKFGNDPDAKLLGQAIDNISRNIGINDRFLIIRELFAGDSDRFTSVVNELDRAESFQVARDILKQQFSDSMDHEGVEILAGLLKRRFIR